MSERISIDDTYTYASDNGHVQILRNGRPWLGEERGGFPGVNAWISAAAELEELRAKVTSLEAAASARGTTGSGQVAPDDGDPLHLRVTPQQRGLLLTALAEHRVDQERYARSYEAPKAPGPLDTCCEGHLARYQARQEEGEMFRDSVRRIEALAAAIEHAGDTCQTVGVAPRA